MGTRSLTVIEDHGKELMVMYSQYDGYPAGHGQALRDRFGRHLIVNGLSGDMDIVANGMGCLAAQVVAHFKEGPGGIYIYPAGTRDAGEEYIYTLYCAESTGPLRLKVQSGSVTFFGQPGSKQSSMNTLYDGPIADFDPTAAEKAEQEAPAPKNDYIEGQKAELKA